MNRTRDEVLEQAMSECIDENMKEVVYNKITKEFSFLEVFSEYTELKKSDRIPKWYNSQFPNASKYDVMNNATYGETKGKEIWLAHDNARKEKVVKILKKIHGVKDPWDDDPDWFKTHKPGDEL